MEKYDHKEIEPKWQKEWAKSGIYKTREGQSQPKFYVLDMFPYPSGEGLHVGHPKGYIATDVFSRYKKMRGFNVLHPMGWDAFGLPAENYAIKNKIHPRKAVEKNIARFKEQLEIIGFNYDWSREINTTDPEYYKWTQWTFLKMFEKGLAYQSNEPVNWCPSCQTVLSNEDLEDGRCERCGSLVEKRPMRQWVLKITDYADRLLKDLDVVEYEMPRMEDKVNPHRDGAPLVHRKVAHAIVFDPKNKKYLIIRNKKHGWDTVIIGGIEGNETAIETATREVREETGYVDIEFKRLLGGPTEASYYTKHKGENRVAVAQAVYFELKSGKRVPIADGEDEDDEVLWIDEADFVPGKMVNSEMPIWLERIKDPNKGFPKALLDWPESIKESQRNWIGRSEGSEFEFKVDNSNENIKVFTTRADTLFGVTYVVLAPENPLVTKFWPMIKNQDQVQDYLLAVKNKTEIERTAEGKEKTGVPLEGVFAVNPATGEKVPVWVADYVLANYGTGAVMAVPAHDERDFEFAKKFSLPIKYVVGPCFSQTTEPGAVRPDSPFVEREAIAAIVKHWSEDKYIGLKWKKVDWDTFITGGVEHGQTPEEGAIAEIKEETGFSNLKLVKILPRVHAKFFHVPKNVNRFAHFHVFYFELKDGTKEEVSIEEQGNHDVVWLSKEELNNFRLPESQRFAWDNLIKGLGTYTGEGLLLNSGEFNNLSSGEAREKITEKFGKKKVTYKLRDWVFSRQRYWGEPIPVIHCERCGVVPVPEKDLPVKLPEVEHYEPTGTGESPLANIPEWVNVKCPKCGGNAKRETNTMPQWAGSSWYYLRYEDPHDDKALVDKQKEKYWSPVDLYVGGAEHATRHLIYARFWHKFLFDIGVVNYLEPFKRLQNVGLILAEDGRKMSKRYGNVVNPDDVVRLYGADTLRLYEMFMGPFNQSASWSTESIIGPRRFLERVWKLSSSVKGFLGSSERIPRSLENLSLTAVLNQTIKKVGEDIEAMKYNTAVSSLMILISKMEEASEITKSDYEIFLQLLAPFAPHITEELWHKLGHEDSIHLSPWPNYDETKATQVAAKIVVQVNGVVRDNLEIGGDVSQSEVEKTALQSPKVAKWVDGKSIKKVIYVKGRLINIVV